MTFKKVDTRQKFPEMEKEILAFWDENSTFKKSLDNRKDAKEYSFYDGPPFATGTPHYGHIVASVMKDVVPRYWTMRGHRVERRWGWDCHGLPIENIVEKEMGSKQKKDIEELGVEKFNEMCRSRVLGYVDEWKKVIGRLGRWADMDNAYRTMDKEFMESVWWVFKELYDKGLIYEGYRSMHICPRCETTLSQSEVSEGYIDIKDLSVTAEFELIDPSQELTDGKKTSVLAWTTTPWTLPGNTALAVHPDIEYALIEKQDEGSGPRVRFIVAKNLIEKHFGKQKECSKKVFLISGKHALASNEYYLKLKKDLENQGYNVTIIDHIDASSPQLQKNIEYFKTFDFSDSHVVVHSLGSSTFLRMLEEIDIHIQSLTMIAPTYPGTSFSSTDPKWMEISGYTGFDIDFEKIQSKIQNKPTLVYSDESAIKKESFVKLGEKINADIIYEEGKDHFFTKEFTREPDFQIDLSQYERENYTIVKSLKGSDLVGLRYKPLFDFYSKVQAPKVLLLTGPGGCGKTTIAEDLHRKYGVTFIDGDYVTSQTVNPSNIWDENRASDLEKAQIAVIESVKEAFDRGEDVVIDYIVYKKYGKFIQKCQDIFGENFDVRVLDPKKDVVIQRDKDRSCWTTGEKRINEVMEEIQKENLSKAFFIDTSDKSVEATIKEYFSELFVHTSDLKNRENGWKIYPADFVTAEDGTGIAHEAPAFGEEDLELAQKYDIPMIQHVGMDGVIAKECGDLAGLHVKPKENHMATDIEVIKFLAKENKLFGKEKYEHSYPHCWRCDTPLINYATSSWFVAVTKVKDKALEYAKDINWSPEHIKEGRFGNWLEGARDWSISRQRFWASVLPVWKCEGCDNTKVFGDVSELERLSGEKIEDLHKHTVDKVTFPCEKCDGIMRRIPDVLDTWFDSGSMPYAQKHYPFENQKDFQNSFPADFIAEGVDQTRCWFYYLHVISTAIQEKPAFKNVIVNGIVLAEDGKKMSKKLKNYPDPMEMFDKYGADSVRYYLMASPVVAAQNLNFLEKDVSEVVRGFMRMLWNSYSFFTLYADIDGWKPDASPKSKVQSPKSLLDRWIVSELQMLIKGVNEHMNSYELHKATRLIPEFIDDLSNWYIRRSRKRFWKSEDDGDKQDAYATLHYVLVELSKVIAPFTPFIAEEIFKNLTEKESVHLEDYPVADESLIDKDLNREMQMTRDIISEGLQIRAKNSMKVRQPLSKLKVKSEKLQVAFEEIVLEELNIKTVEYDENQEENIVLDLELTPKLKLEGQAREVIRHIQALRKEAGYEVDDRIKVFYEGGEEVFTTFGDSIITKEVLATKLDKGIPAEVDITKSMKGEDITIALRK